MIWLTGRDGMVGREVASALTRAGLEFVASGQEVDITDADAVSRFARDARPDWIVNCAAYTAVDRAEAEEAEAFAVNATGVGLLAAAAREHGAAVLHISTDYVFGNHGDTPHHEDDPLGPTGVYGRSKASGERLLRETVDRSVIVRTSWLYGHGRSNFVTTMLRLFAERDEVTVVSDQHGAPTSARDLAGALVRMLVCIADGSAGGEPHGIYHFANSGVTTWYDFACEILRRASELGLIPGQCLVRPVLTREFPRPAPRPANSRLSIERIAGVFGIVPRPWREALHEYLDELHDDRQKEASQ